MNILLIRTSALGDVVHCLPVLTALRRHFPGAKIGWIVESGMAPVLGGHADLDELLVVRLRAWRKQPFSASTIREVAAFRERLEGFTPDVTLDLMGNHKAAFLSALTFCDRRIGPAREDRREPSSAFWISEPVTVRGDHAVDRSLSLLDALGIPREPADFGGEKLFRDPPEGAQHWLAEHTEPFILIHPGAGWASKRYPPERWGEVARRLKAAAGLDTWVPVGPGEERLAADVATASGGAARTVPADLPTLAALLRRARLVMGGDSGPTHLAHALGAPVLMLMGPTDPARHGPYGEPERALWKRLPCSFCYRRFEETKACLLEIPADRVAERAFQLLDCPP
ncbi:MAG TPA: lipopolysaccharide heptosyltransferase I [Thermoanaerobaculia bacterium]|nr:lipopolysaccharide heptosyltransferase I [Thermoanaerobaculia bacterium]